MEIINGRYQVLKVIGNASDGKIYKVIDKEDSKEYSLKIFSKNVDKSFLADFSSSFFKYTRLTHPNILKDYRFDIVHDFNFADRQYFFVYEYLDAEKNLSYDKLSFEEQKIVLEKIIYAIKYLHFKDVVYKYLMFSNINIFRNQQGEIDVKLNNLGITYKSTDYVFSSINPESRFISTSLEDCGKSADVFSLAKIAYFLITGKEAVKDVVNIDRDIKPIYPLVYEAMAQSTGPIEDRPDSVDMLWEAFVNCLDISNKFWDKEYYRTVDFKTELLGHKEELKKVKNMIMDFYHGETQISTVFVKSSLGVGKSRFLNELKHHIRMKSLNPIYCDKSVYDDGERAFSFFRGVIRALFKKFAVPAYFIKEHGDDIVKLVPEYADIWGVAPSKTLEKDNENKMLTTRILKLISEIALANNFVIILDDVDSMDSTDLNLLYNLMTGSSSRRPFLVLSVNDMPFSDDAYNFVIPYEYIELAPFNHYNTVEYIKYVLNVDDFSAKKLAREVYPIVHGNAKNMEKVITYLLNNDYIYINENRKFTIKDFDILSFPYYRDLDFQQGNHKFELLDDNAKYLAKIFSVYANKFDENLALEFSGLDEKMLHAGLDTLLDAKILRKITSNWGTCYDFYDYKVLSTIYISLDVVERANYHDKCRQYYEDGGVDADPDFDSYIFHVVNSGNVRLAVEKLLEKCQQKYSEKDYISSLDYLGCAEDISDELQDYQVDLEILVWQCKSNYKLGNIGVLVKNYNEIYEISVRNDALDYKYYALTSLANIYIIFRRVDEYNEVMKDVADIVENGKDLDEVFYQSKDLLTLKKLVVNYNGTELARLSEKFIADYDSESSRRYHFVARYYHSLSYIFRKDYGKAIEVVNDILATADVKEYPSVLIKCYNELGWIYQTVFFESEKAYREFCKAIELLEQEGLDWENADVYINFAKTLQSMGRYSEAFDIYKKVERIAVRTNQHELLSRTLNQSIEVSLLMEKYQIAVRKNDKFQKLIASKSSGISKRCYFYNKVLEANLCQVFKKFKKVEILLNQIESEGLEHFERSELVSYYALKILFDYTAQLEKGAEFDSVEIGDIEKLIKSPMEKIIFRETLFTMAVHSFALKDLNVFNNIVAVIKYNKNFIVIDEASEKHRYLDILSSDCDITRLKNLLYRSQNCRMNYLWKLYYIVGNLEFDKENYVDALYFYLEAIDKYYDRLYSFPEEYRLINMQNSTIFKELLNKIIALRKDIYGLPIDKVQDMYFNYDEQLKEIMLRDDRVKEILYNYYHTLNGVHIPTVEDYLKSMTEDKEKNVENMLYYFAHTTLSEKAYITIIDDDDSVIASFGTSGCEKPEHFASYVSAIKKNTDFVLIEKRSSAHNFYKNQSEKNVLVFPICKSDMNSSKFLRRTEDFNNKENIIAYVYLESSLMLSLINVDKLNELRRYDGLNSLVITNYTMYKKSSVDKLTGVFIRNVVEKHVDSTIKRVENMNYSFSVLMIDIDNFKHVNDTYGHMRGDEILIQLGKTLKTSLRKKDIVGRYGGEEFIAVINNADSETAFKVADKLRMAVEAEKMLGQDENLTISIGVSTYPKDGVNYSKLVENADKALYVSKRTGRNKVTSYSPEIGKIKNDNTSFTGVFSTNASENAIKTKVILDIAGLVSKELDKNQKIKKALQMILDVIDGKQLCIVRQDGEDIVVKKEIRLGQENIIVDSIRDKILSASEGGYFVNWEDGEKTNFKDMRKDWMTYVFTKIIKDGNEIGRLVVCSSIKSKEYSNKDYNYLKSLSPIIASLL